MDGERQYPTPREPWVQDDRWPPGRHDGSHVTDERRYADDPRFGDQGYAPRYEDARYPEPPQPEDPRATDGPRRRDSRAGAPARRVGRRSGIELPADDPGPEDGRDERFHTESLDRAALRRPEYAAHQPAEPAGYLPAGMDPGGTGTPGAPISLLSAAGGPAAAGGPGPLPSLLAPPETAAGADPVDPGPAYLAGHGPTQPLPSGATVYRPRRPGIAALLAFAAIAAELLVTIKVLFDAVGAHPTNTGGVLAGLFAMAGIPMVAMGLYGLATGAATAGGPNVGRAWLRTPLAYLPVGLVLIMAAGMAS